MSDRSTSSLATEDPAGDAEALSETWLDVEDAQAGDRAAFDRLYRAFAPIVHGIGLAHASWSDAEDIVQDVFVVAWNRLGELRDVQAFGGWLSQIARRRAIDGHRRRRPAEPLMHEPMSSQRDPTEALSVLAVIRRLPPAYRETLILRLVQGMTGPEIAMKTGRTAGSVRVNLHRGMAQLRRELRGRREDD